MTAEYLQDLLAQAREETLQTLGMTEQVTQRGHLARVDVFDPAAPLPDLHIRAPRPAWQPTDKDTK